MCATKCGYCGKPCDNSSINCPGCGTPLKEPVLSAVRPYPAAAKSKMVRGIFWLTGGSLVTFASFAAATPGGTYWVSWGAIAYGIFQIVTGLLDCRKTQEEIIAERALEIEFQKAVMVEARGDILLARAIYHDLSTKFPNTKIGRDAKNALASMAAHRPDMN
jgi:hypothetical protein